MSEQQEAQRQESLIPIDGSLVFARIGFILEIAGKPLAAHEFTGINLQEDGLASNGLYFVGCSEATLARRMREMREQGYLTSRIRQGKTFAEYSLTPTYYVVTGRTAPEAVVLQAQEAAGV